jgi:hypothetical protein
MFFSSPKSPPVLSPISILPQFYSYKEKIGEFQICYYFILFSPRHFRWFTGAKYILLLSIVQSQPTHTLATCNQATGFSSNSHHQVITETMKIKNSIHLVRGRRASYQIYVVFNFHIILSRPDDFSLS